MKKLSVIFAILAAASMFTACEYQNVYPKETIYTTNSKTLDIHVLSADWTYSSKGGYYYYTASVPELTKTIYDTGVITCYREFNYGTANAYRMNLPRVFPMVDSGSSDCGFLISGRASRDRRYQLRPEIRPQHQSRINGFPSEYDVVIIER